MLVGYKRFGEHVIFFSIFVSVPILLLVHSFHLFDRLNALVVKGMAISMGLFRVYSIELDN